MANNNNTHRQCYRYCPSLANLWCEVESQWNVPFQKCVHFPQVFLGDLSCWPSNQNCTISAFRLALPSNCITSCNFSFLGTIMSISLSKCFILRPQHSHLAYGAKSMNQVKGRWGRRMCEIEIKRKKQNERLIPTAQYYLISAAEHGQGSLVTLFPRAILGCMSWF